MRPILFRLEGPGWEVQTYGVVLGLALIAGYLISLTLARRDRLPVERLGTAYVLGAAVGLFAGRAGWLLQHPKLYAGASSVFTLQAGTFAPFFAIVVALAVSAVLAARAKVPVLAWFDVLAPSFAIGVCLERLGALAAGSGAGTYAPDLPWAIRYPAGSDVFAQHVRRLSELMPAGATESLPVHPTPVYGLLLGLVGVAWVVHQRRHRRFTGQVFLRYGAYYVVARSFVEEWFRVDAASPVVGPLNPGQVGAVVALVLLLIVHRVHGRRTEPLRAWEGGRWSPASEPASQVRSKTRAAATGGLETRGRKGGRRKKR